MILVSLSLMHVPTNIGVDLSVVIVDRQRWTNKRSETEVDINAIGIWNAYTYGSWHVVNMRLVGPEVSIHD